VRLSVEEREQLEALIRQSAKLWSCDRVGMRGGAR
jgi:hypothetical protein